MADKNSKIYTTEFQKREQKIASSTWWGWQPWDSEISLILAVPYLNIQPSLNQLPTTIDFSS